jgi:prepilin-type N-terminal cleavage/methylation domain-containing protein
MQRGFRRLSIQRGFTLIEMLVVIAVILLLMGFILPALSSARQRRLVLLATSEVKQIAAAATAYFDRFHMYPPDTEPFLTGNNKEVTTPDPEAIYKYLGRKIIDKNTGVEYGPFLQLKLDFLKGPNQMTYMDPWNKPYHMDCIHSMIDKNTGEVTVYGEPYPSGGSADDQANRAVEVKVWSNGPDGDEVDGSKSFVGKNGTENGGTGSKENNDNICSWEAN